MKKGTIFKFPENTYELNDEIYQNKIKNSVQKELNELNDKIKKLSTFLDSEEIKEIDELSTRVVEYAIWCNGGLSILSQC